MKAGGARDLGAGPLKEPAHVYHHHQQLPSYYYPLKAQVSPSKQKPSLK